MPKTNHINKVYEETNVKNGAANGIRLEPFYYDLAHYALHEIETMNNIKRFHYA